MKNKNNHTVGKLRRYFLLFGWEGRRSEPSEVRRRAWASCIRAGGRTRPTRRYPSWRKNSPHPTPDMDFASFLFFFMPLMFRCSTATRLFSLAKRVVSLWRKSPLHFLMRSCTLATAILAFSWLMDLGIVLERCLWARARFFIKCFITAI